LLFLQIIVRLQDDLVELLHFDVLVLGLHTRCDVHDWTLERVFMFGWFDIVDNDLLFSCFLNFDSCITWLFTHLSGSKSLLKALLLTDFAAFLLSSWLVASFLRYCVLLEVVHSHLRGMSLDILNLHLLILLQLRACGLLNSLFVECVLVTMELLDDQLVRRHLRIWIDQSGILEHLKVLFMQTNALGVRLVHLAKCLNNPLKLSDNFGAFGALPKLLHVSLHHSFDDVPAVSHLIGCLGHSRALKVDSLLDFLPFTFAYVVDGDKQLRNFCVSPCGRFRIL